MALCASASLFSWLAGPTASSAATRIPVTAAMRAALVKAFEQSVAGTALAASFHDPQLLPADSATDPVGDEPTAAFDPANHWYYAKACVESNGIAPSIPGTGQPLVERTVAPNSLSFHWPACYLFAHSLSGHWRVVANAASLNCTGSLHAVFAAWKELAACPHRLEPTYRL